MKKVMKIVLFILLFLIVVIICVYAYYGGFKKVVFRSEIQGGEIMVYQEVVGDYRQAGKVSDNIYHILLNDYKIETYKGVGVFYDNPNEVEKSKLRSDIGCILEPRDTARQAELQNKFKIRTLSNTKYLVAEFPHKGMMSVFVGLLKVYPALNKYIKENNINIDTPIMEIYDVPNKKIIYRKEIK